MQKNIVYYKDSSNMAELDNCSIDLIITSPPYFNIKDYAKDGKQSEIHSEKQRGQIGDISNYQKFICSLLTVWQECERVLKPNGKLAINSPLMPMLKRDMNTHHNRHIFDIDADIQHSILQGSGLFLYNTYIWNRVNSSRPLMFGSYPYPPNFYGQNTSEFITIYVKDGKPEKRDGVVKDSSKLTKEEWVSFTKDIWDIPIPNKKDLAYGVHPAIMPAEIPYRLIRLFSFKGDVVLDPFAGSGTTLKVAKENGRSYIGYEIVRKYRDLINQRLDIG
jgi:modification methylase